ncbi:extensin [Gossypium arboreum]|uniref:extensin n=1 Tax=Gossypium arboreum TaxID=29729 RepID=UPI0008194AAA|nr:extensin [Gossypium arboreum]
MSKPPRFDLLLVLLFTVIALASNSVTVATPITQQFKEALQFYNSPDCAVLVDEDESDGEASILIPAFVILVAIWISAFNLDYMVLGEDSSALLPSPSLSGYPSYGAPPSPQSFSGYPSYGASPPPPPPSSISTYPSYRAPTPPSRPAQANCPPPPVPVQCCQYPYHPNPNEYYQPVDDHSPTPYSPLSTFSIVIFCCFILALSMR